MAQETAIVAGGCFWCTEAVFRDVIGVSAVASGYIGGTVPDPTYKQVCSGTTGHAEAIRVTYDPSVISHAEILDVFMGTHDPTQLNRQGNDVGTQYRSGDRAVERRAWRRRGDDDRRAGRMVPGRGLSSGILGRRRAAQSVLPGDDSAQAAQAQEELPGKGQVDLR